MKKAGILPAFFDGEGVAQDRLNLDRPEWVRAAGLPPRPFFAVVAADFTAMQAGALDALADVLVGADAMWVAACGADNARFIDAVDEASLRCNKARGQDFPLVMTSWHEGETVEEVASFLSIMKPHKEWGEIETWDTVVISIGETS